MAKTYEEINEKIRSGKAVVLTAEEVVGYAAENGVDAVAKNVDVVTTGTFGPMCSSGAFINTGHSEPPIKMNRAWLNDVPVYCGLAAVDIYLGATELSETEGMRYGGAHVIEDLIDGKSVKLRSTAYGTDCYPRKEIETWINLETLNQAYLFNPRNVYQNYAVATNSSDKTLYTYMGELLPNLRNATFCSAGQLSPLLNDPTYRTVGVGTRIFLAGAQGYVAWEGTQHNPNQNRDENGVPTAPAGTLALIGDMKRMDTRFIRGCTFVDYGTSIYMGVGIPIPILDEDLAASVSRGEELLTATILDYAVPSRSRPSLGKVTYAQLRTGEIEINGKKVMTGPISSYAKAREIAGELKGWIEGGNFTLTEPLQPLPADQGFKPLDIKSGEAI
jgi:uncharacterized protein (DUF39 family)